MIDTLFVAQKFDIWLILVMIIAYTIGELCYFGYINKHPDRKRLSINVFMWASSVVMWGVVLIYCAVRSM